MQNYELLVERITKLSGLQKEEVERKIEAKKAKLSGLISKEGAAQIIAAELGVSLENVDVKINELMPGMRKINIIGKVIQLFPVREFEKQGRSGKVANFRIADETGNCRVVLWDINHIKLIENGEIRENDTIQINNATLRDTELHLSSFSEIRKSKKEIVKVKTVEQSKETSLDSIINGQNIMVRGLVVQLYPIRFYNVCSECNKKVELKDNKFICAEHGQVQPQKKGILNFVLDDGTDSVRVVLFSDAINKISKEEELEDLTKFELFKNEFLGNEIILKGNVRKNTLFNNLEIIGNDIETVDVEKIIESLEAKS